MIRNINVASPPPKVSDTIWCFREKHVTYISGFQEPNQSKKGDAMKLLVLFSVLLPLAGNAASNYKCNDVVTGEGKISYDLTESAGAYTLLFTAVEHQDVGTDPLKVGTKIEISSQLEVKYNGAVLGAECKKIEKPSFSALGNGQFQFKFFLDCGPQDQFELASTCSAN